MIDECYSDAELIELFTEENITSPERAVQHCHALHDLWLEREQEIRSQIF